MRAFGDTQLNKRSFRVPAGVTLRECSVVIIGSTCKTCGRVFKCDSDVSLHSRWRHNGTMKSLIDLHHEIYLDSIGQKCDICDMQLQTVSDLKIHKRLIHKHGTRSKYRKRPGKTTVRVKFKLNGMTTMDVNLNRKYLKTENNLRCFIDADTQTPDSFEIKKHQDNCAADIDLFLSDYVVNNSHMQDIWPHKAANRYIVSKFTSTKGDAIARSAVVGRSLLEISNTPHRDVISGNNDSCEEFENRRNLTSQKNTSGRSWIKSLFDNLDIYNKENSQRKLNELERKNVYCQAESNDNKISLTYQRDKVEKTTSLTYKQLANEIHHDLFKHSNEVGDKGNVEFTNYLADSEKIIIDNENNNKIALSEIATKRLLAPLTQNSFKRKNESMIKNNTNIDDDVQEVLRITRRNLQSDINHESPNRTEREILVQNTSNETFTYSTRRKSTICSEKCDSGYTANFEQSCYPAFSTVTKSSYQYLANAFDKKFGISLEDMHHHEISYYNELAEINNNNLEEYAIYAHQGFFEPRMQPDREKS